MTKRGWKTKIIQACRDAGTYEAYFDSVIETLAEILEKRDAAEKLYKETGSKPIVEHTNKANQSNLVKNPILMVWDELNKSALAYWRDLGLTPAGLRHITNAKMGKKKRSKMEAAIDKLV